MSNDALPDPLSWRPLKAPSLVEFEVIATEAYRRLPAEFPAKCEAYPEKVNICHCTDCQTGTGSAFRVSVPIPGSVFKMRGQPTNYVKTTSDSGNPRIQAFCPKCGSPIYSTTPGEGQQASYMVRVGILKERDQLAPQKQSWFRSARSWVTHMDAIPKNQKQRV